ncbi:hypothetical protein HDU96_009437 [Phlyctochytrium bullatum]|nr:hypothetical protein HDU96_009437 [Phlyctochytrium bullatum]
MASPTGSSDCDILVDAFPTETKQLQISLQLSDFSLCCFILPNNIKCNAANRITELYLNDTVIVRPFPVALTRLTAIQTLELSSNNISGSIPPEIGKLTNLVRLNLSKNLLSGSIPSDLYSLQNLIVLNLSSNFLNGSFPDETYIKSIAAKDSSSMYV